MQDGWWRPERRPIHFSGRHARAIAALWHQRCWGCFHIASRSHSAGPPHFPCCCPVGFSSRPATISTGTFTVWGVINTMTEVGQQRALTTAFAPPPPLWKHFSAENIKRLEEIKKDASRGDDGKVHTKKWTPAELRSLELPPELHYLVPPEIPTSGHYSVFGELQSVRVFLLINWKIS